MVILLLHFSGLVAGNSMMFTTRVLGAGWSISTTAARAITFRAEDAGVGTTSTGGTCFGWQLTGITYDDSGNQVLYANGAVVDTDNVAALGLIGAGLGVGINSRTDGTNSNRNHIQRAMAWYGAGIADIADADFHRDLAAHVLGYADLQANDQSTYARASSRCYYSTGPANAVEVVSQNGMPAGNIEGVGADEQIVSVTDYNCCLVAGGLAALNAKLDVGLVGTLQTEAGADLVALQAAFPWSDGVVYDIDNPTGGVLYARLGNANGGVAESWVSIRARVLTGPVPMGWQTAAGAFSQAVAAIGTGYARSSGTSVPLATDRQALAIPAGGQVRIIMWSAGIGARIPDEVPSLAAAGVSTTVAQGIMTTAVTQNNVAGCVEVDLVPRLWGGAVPAVVTNPVYDGALVLVAISGAANTATTADGTNTAVVALTEADATAETIRHNHGDRGLHIAIDGVAETLNANYDGAMGGVLSLRGTHRAVRGFRYLRNPLWRI
jgi:hypothetical protein